MPAFIGQRDFHKWYLEGKRVKVLYLGEYEATGVVESYSVVMEDKNGLRF